MGADCGERVRCDLAELRVVAPDAERCRGADDQGGEGERDQEKVEANVWACGEPVDQVACGLRWFVGSGLNVAEKEREHEEGGGKDEEDFGGGDKASEKHSSFIMQSTMCCQVYSSECARRGGVAPLGWRGSIAV
jgi:hypothetical protein